MLLCWNPEKGSPIHNHAGSECFMRVLGGRIVEKQYIVRNGEGDLAAKCNWNKMTCSNIPPSDLIKSHENIYEEGGCTFINDSLGVHQVENPYKEPAITVSLHIETEKFV
jgi:cysteine dioxygenase